jgi:hypothetical protein
VAGGADCQGVGSGGAVPGAQQLLDDQGTSLQVRGEQQGNSTQVRAHIRDSSVREATAGAEAMRLMLQSAMSGIACLIAHVELMRHHAGSATIQGDNRSTRDMAFVDAIIHPVS